MVWILNKCNFEERKSWNLGCNAFDGMDHSWTQLWVPLLWIEWIQTASTSALQWQVCTFSNMSSGRSKHQLRLFGMRGLYFQSSRVCQVNIGEGNYRYMVWQSYRSNTTDRCLWCTASLVTQSKLLWRADSPKSQPILLQHNLALSKGNAQNWRNSTAPTSGPTPSKLRNLEFLTSDNPWAITLFKTPTKNPDLG